VETLTSDESSLLQKIRQLSGEQRAQLARTVDEMRESRAAAQRRLRLAAFDRAVGSWGDMSDAEAEALWHEIHAMRGVEEHDVPA